MSREYTVSSWQPWEDKETNELIKDLHGNFKGTVWFDEDTRQADATFKVEPSPGDKKYGDLIDYTTKAGKTRLKFQRADRPDNQTSIVPKGDNPQSPKKEWKSDDEFWSNKDGTIQAEWAIGKAVLVLKDSDLDFEKVEGYAKKFYAMVDRVKGGEATNFNPNSRAQSIKALSEATSGYDKFKASKPSRDEDAEAESLYVSIASSDFEEDE